MADKREPGPFDERAALDELERFREEIARERARRKALSDEFEAFTGSFRKPAAPAREIEAPPPPAVPRPLASPAAPASRAESAPAAASPARTPPSAPAPPRIELPRQRAEAAAPTPVRGADRPAAPAATVPAADERPRGRRSVQAFALIALLIVAGISAWALWPSSSATTAPAATETAPATPADASGPPPVPADTPGVQSEGSAPAPEPLTATAELTTTRNVWVRVIADGERVLERELPAGSRIPITAQKTIVIRTGDADAVRLAIDGNDQGSFGREGQVVTRTFTVRE